MTGAEDTGPIGEMGPAGDMTYRGNGGSLQGQQDQMDILRLWGHWNQLEILGL